LQIPDEQKQYRHTVRTLCLDALELFISAKKGFIVIAWLGWQKYSEYGSALAVGSRAF
jgi:hypothetical protein